MDQRDDRDGAGLDRGIDAKHGAHHLLAHLVRLETFGGFAASVAPLAELRAASADHDNAGLRSGAGLADLLGQVAHHAARQGIALVGTPEIDPRNAVGVSDGKCETGHGSILDEPGAILHRRAVSLQITTTSLTSQSAPAFAKCGQATTKG